ncbi:ribokinase [Oryzobacter sp. R7]|uniref:ribokinase n=1 Tax=Oryzobacter faecalis TaxID=3388656 RepID=UPI00398D2BB1
MTGPIVPAESSGLAALSGSGVGRPGGTIAVVGSAKLDLVIRQERLPRPGETVLGRTFDRVPGGKGLNQAVAAARAGGRVAFLGRVGDDAEGRQLAQTLRPESVDTHRLITDPTRGTGIAQVSVLDGGENAIVVAAGANASSDWSPDDEALLTTAAAVVAQLERPVPLVRRAFEAARALGVFTVLTPAPVSADALALLPLVDLLLLNEHEARALAAQEDPLAAARSLSPGRIVILTRGSASTLVAHEGALVHDEPARPAAAVDTTGAGDCFAGTLVARLASGDSFKAAIGAATVAASLSVARPGAAASMPTWVEIEANLGGNEAFTG